MKEIEDPLSERILKGDFKPGDTVRVDVRGEGDDQEVVFRHAEPMLAEGAEVPALSGLAEN